MNLAIVILNWNGELLLQKFLPSIVNYSNLKNVEIYVVDNGSTDNSISFTKEKFPTVKIVKNKSNFGFARGYNESLKRIKADIYCLINSDVEVTRNWLNPIIQTFENEENTAIIQPKILDYQNREFFEYAGAGGGFIDKLGYPYCRGRIFSEIEKNNGQYDDTKEIFWASGACFFIRSEIYNNLGGFDENYSAHQEEIDLCWRAKNIQKTVKYVGKSTVFHIGGATLEEGNPKRTFLNFRNSLFSLVKNLPKDKLLPIIFTRLILDGIAGVKFLLELRPIHTFKIIEAHFSFYYYLPRMLKKRKNIQRKKYYSIKNIVWKHYALGIKKFKDL